MLNTKTKGGCKLFTLIAVGPLHSQNVMHLRIMSFGHYRIDAVMGPPSEREVKISVSR